MARGRRRWASLAAAVGVLAAAAMLALPDEAGADMERCAEHRATREWVARSVTGHGEPVVVIGDSYSVGSGLASGAAWPSRLAGQVRVDGFGGSGFSRHASFCGAVSFSDRAPRALEDVGDDALVVVQGGLNDFDQSDAEIEAGFTRLLKTAGVRRVVVVGPPSAPARADDVPRIDALLAGLAERHRVPYLSMTAHEFPYLPDGLHLTAEGHRMFGDAVASGVAALG